MDVATRSAEWLGQVVDLMREPSDAMPVPRVLTMLQSAFCVTGASWNWFDPDGSFGMVLDPPEHLLGEEETLRTWLTGEILDCHALIQWFLIVGDLRPQTTARVPTRIVSRRKRLVVERALLRLELDQQLSIVYKQRGALQRSFVLARTHRDFSDDDLELALVVQRSMVALDHQITVMQRMTGAHTGVDLGLTGRELAVLQLIAEGASTRRAARELACSPRTVEKHLENAYRRLGVKDRLNAIRVLRTAGVLGSALPPDHRVITGPGAYRGPIPRTPRGGPLVLAT